MDGREAWRVIACTDGAKDKTIINRIMLRFRPIAPKPATGESSSGGWKPEGEIGLVHKGRTKRKYVRVKKKSEIHRRRRKTIKESDQTKVQSVRLDTIEKGFPLQLLPEKIQDSPSTLVQGSCSGGYNRFEEKIETPMSFNFIKQDMGGAAVADLKVVTAVKRVVETWVTVESVTGTCMDGVVGLGSTDVDKMKNLESDACPGFISDGLNCVQWVNEAYKEMVMVEPENGSQPTVAAEIRVRLVMKEKVLARMYTCTAFTCWVRLMRYTWRKEKWSQIAVPCDVWKLENGGFAWRLDVNTALSLGSLQ